MNFLEIISIIILFPLLLAVVGIVLYVGIILLMGLLNVIFTPWVYLIIIIKIMIDKIQKGKET